MKHHAACRGLAIVLTAAGFTPEIAAQSSASAIDSAGILIELPVQGLTVRARVFPAAGAGPHATLVELKGFNQRDAWMAPAAPAMGLNGVSLDFRGANTSDGLYAPDQTPADVAALVALLRTDRARREWNVDPDRLIVIGTSAGTLGALTTLANDPRVACGGAVVPFNWGMAGALAGQDTSIRAQFVAMMNRIRGDSTARVRPVPDLVARVMANADAINTTSVAARLGGKSVFLAGARRDQTAPLMLHFHPLVAAARNAGALIVRDTVVDDVHTIPDTWESILDALWRWVDRECLHR